MEKRAAPISSIFKVAVSYFTAVVMTLQPTYSFAQAPAIVVDSNAAAANQASLDKAANLTDIVNIVAPNNSGWSVNHFTDFNVPEQGVIINNSTENGISVLGGPNREIRANPHLTDGAADNILAQVTSSNASQLDGFTEIFGNQANFVLANGNGITCNGCGFIQTPMPGIPQDSNKKYGGAFIAGTPVINSDGGLIGATINDGTVTITGDGLDASRLDYFDIVTRSAKVNATIWAGERLNITTGKGDFARNAETGEFEADSEAEADENSPEFAIDASALGSMYAGRIKLVGNEKGVGIHSRADMAASAGDLVMQADGNISFAGAFAQQDVKVTSKSGSVKQTKGSYAGRNIKVTAKKDATIEGQHAYAGGDITINAEGKVAAKQTIAAPEGETTPFIDAQDLAVTAGSELEFDGVKASIANDTSLIAVSNAVFNDTDLSSDNVMLTAVDITATGLAILARLGNSAIQGNHIMLDQQSELIAIGNNNVTATGNLNNAGIIWADDKLTILSQDLTNNGQLHAGNALTIDANNILNSLGTISSASSITLISQGSVTNDEVIAAAGDITINAESLINRDEIFATNNATLTTENDLINQGTISAGGDVSATSIAGAITNENTFLAEGQLALDAKTTVTNKGDLLARGTLTALAENITQTASGLVQSLQEITLTALQHLRSDGDIIAAGNITLNATDLTNKGSVASEKTIAATVSDTLLNEGSIRAVDDIIIGFNADKTASFINKGLLATGGDLTINAAILNNQNTHNRDAEGNILSGLYAANNMTINAGILLNSAGYIESAGAMTMNTTGDITSNTHNDIAAVIASGKVLTINAASALNNDGSTITANDAATITGTTAISNQAGRIVSNQHLSIASDGRINNQAGTVAATNDVTITANTLDNSNTKNADPATLDTGILAGGKADITVTNALTNSQGDIFSGINTAITTGSLDNTGGRVEAVASVSASTTGDMNNNTGTLRAGTDVTLNAATITNDTGLINAENKLTITADTLTNSNTGTLDGEGNLASGIYGGEGLSLTVSTLLDNTAGFIYSGRFFDIIAKTFSNTGGTVRSAGNTADETDGSAITANSNFSNDNGLIATADDLTITTQNGTNSGVIETATNLTAENIANSGTLFALDTLTATGGSNSGIIRAGEQVTINHQGTFDNTDGLIQSFGEEGVINLNVTTGITGGEVVSNKALTITTNHDFETSAVLSSGESVSITAKSILNKGVVEAVDIINLLATGTITNAATGALVSDNNIRAESTIASITNAGEITTPEAVMLLAKTNITNDTDAFINSGKRLSATAEGTLTNKGELASINENVTLSAATIIQDNAVIYALGNAAITAADITNQNSSRIIANNNLSLDATGTITNDNSEILVQNDLTVTAGTLTNNNRMQARGKAHVTAGTISNEGLLNVEETLTIAADNVTNKAGGALTIEGDINATVTDQFTNEGTLQTLGALSVANGASNSQKFTNTGALSASNDITIKADSITNNNTHQRDADGNLTAGLVTAGNLALTGKTISNTGGYAEAGGTIGVTATESINNNNGTFASTEKLTIAGGTLTNNSGTISAASAEGVQIIADALSNAGGFIWGVGKLTIESATNLINNAGTVGSNGDITITAATIDNSNTKNADPEDLQTGILAAGSLDITAIDSLTNKEGEIFSGKTTNIIAPIVDNNQGRIDATENLTITSTTRLDNTAGLLRSGQATALEAGIFGNNGGLTRTEKDLTITATTLTNDNTGALDAEGNLTSGIYAGEDVAFTVTDTFSNQSGFLYSDGLADITAATVNNNQGTIRSTGNTADTTDGTTITATSNFTNQDGAIVADDDLTIKTANGTSSGTIQTAKNLAINQTTNGTFANSGDLLAFDTLKAKEISNVGGTISAGNKIALSHSGTFDNTDGVIQSYNEEGTIDLDITTGITGGDITSNKAITINTTADFETSATISTAEHISITAQSIINKGILLAEAAINFLASGDITNTADGTLTSNGAITVESTTASITNSGSIATAETISLTAATDITNNTDALVTSGKALSVVANNITNQGQLASTNDAVTVTATDTLGNNNGLIYANNNANLTAKTLTNQNQARVIANDNLTVNATTITNDNSELLAEGTLTANSTALTNRNGALLQGAAGVALTNTADITNDNATIISGADLTATATNITNHNQAKLLVEDNLNLTATTDITNDNSQILAKENLTASAQNLTNKNGAITQALGTAGLTTATLTNNATLVSTGDLTITANDINNQASAYLGTENNLHANLAHGITNDGSVEVTGSATIHHNNAATNNVTNKGVFIVGNNLDITTDNFTNAHTHQRDGEGNLTAGLIAQGNVNLTTTNFNNQAGYLEAGNALTIAAQNDLLNNAHNNIAAVIAAGGLLTLTTNGSLNNNGSSLSTTGVATITATNGITSNNGFIWADNNLTLDTDEAISNQAGTIGSSQNVTITAKSLDNSNTKNANPLEPTLGVLSSGTMTITTTGAITNNEGDIFSAKTLALQAESISNNKGKIESTEALTLTTQGAITNIEGTIRSDNNVTLTTNGDVSNEQGLISSNNNLAISAANITNDTTGARNAEGAILTGMVASNNVTLTATGTINNQSGLIASKDGFVTADADTITNDNGTINSAGAAIPPVAPAGFAALAAVAAPTKTTITANNLSNNQGIIVANDDLTIEANNLTNSGAIQSATMMRINRGRFAGTGMIHNTGQILALDELVISQINNQNGRLQAGNMVEVFGGNLLDNRDGLIQGFGVNGIARIHANSILGGDIVTTEAITLNINGDYENTSNIYTDGLVDINATSITNKALISSADTITFLSSGNITNEADAQLIATNGIDLESTAGNILNQGQISTDGTLRVAAAGTIDNTSTTPDKTATLRAKDAVTITADDAFTNSGEVISDDSTTSITATTITNSNLISAKNNATLAATTGTITNSTDATIQSFEGDVTLTTPDAILNQGNILQGAADKAVTLTAGKTITNEGEIIATGTINLTATAAADEDAINNSNLISAGTGINAQATTGNITNQTDGTIQTTTGTLVLKTPGTVFNEGALLSGNAATINADQFIQDSGVVLTIGDITIEGITAGTRMSVLRNSTGSIENFGDNSTITLRAQLLENIGVGDSVRNSEQVASSVMSGHRPPWVLQPEEREYGAGSEYYHQLSDGGQVAYHIWLPHPDEVARILEDNNLTIEELAAEGLDIYTPIHLDGGWATHANNMIGYLNANNTTLEEVAGIFLTNGGLRRFVSNVWDSSEGYYNSTVYLNRNRQRQAAKLHLIMDSYGITLEQLAAGNYAELFYNFIPEGEGVDYAAWSVYALDEHWQGHYDTTESLFYNYDYDALTADAAASTTISSGDIIIDAGDITNYVSTISAATDLTINADNLTNEGITLSETHGYSASFDSPAPHYWLVGWAYDNDSRLYRNLELDNIPYLHNEIDAAPAIISAGQTLTGTIGDTLTNQAVAATSFEDLSFAGSAATIVITGDRAHNPIIPGLETAPELTAEVARLVQDAPEASNHLKESRLPFIDQSSLVGSEYFLDQVDYDATELPTSLGDAFVDMRLIEGEILEQTGNRFLDGAIDNSGDQLRALIDNAALVADDLNLEVGAALTDSQIAALESDIVWYEFIEVDGQQVLAPKLYLGNGTQTLEHAGAVISAQNTTLDVGTLQQSRGTIAGTAALNINADGDIVSQSSSLEGGDVTLISGGDIALNRPTFTTGNGESRIGTLVDRSNRINATGNLTINVANDLILAGTSTAADGSTLITAANNIFVTPIQAYYEFHRETEDSKTDIQRLTHLSESIFSGADLTLGAGNDLTLQGIKLASLGDINLLANGNIGMIAAKDDYYFHNEWKKSGSFGREGSGETTISIQEHIATVLDAGGSITITSFEGDLISKAAEFLAKQDVNLTSENGKIYLLSEKDSDFKSVSKEGSNHAWVSMEDRGHHHETVRHTKITAEGQIRINAAKGVIADIKWDGKETFDEAIDKIANEPGMEWLQQLRDNDDVTWNAIEEIHKEWNESHSGLSPIAAAVIAIAVTILTMGAAAQIGFAAATSAGATTTVTTTATVAGITTTTTTTALTTTGVAISGAVAAGVTSLASQAAVSLINNRGNLGDVFADLTSSEAIKALAITMVTAGLTKGAAAKFDLKSGLKATFMQRLTSQAVNTGVRAGVSVAAGEDLDVKQMLVDIAASAAVDTVGAYLSQGVKTTFDDGGTLQTALRYAAHTAIGCGSAAAKGADCAAGAAGAFAGELAGDIYRKINEKVMSPADFEKLQDKGIKISRFTGAIAAAFVAAKNGGDADDVYAGADAAEIAAQYNAFFSSFEDFQANQLELIRRKPKEEQLEILSNLDDGYYQNKMVKDYLLEEFGTAPTHTLKALYDSTSPAERVRLEQQLYEDSAKLVAAREFVLASVGGLSEADRNSIRSSLAATDGFSNAFYYTLATVPVGMDVVGGAVKDNVIDPIGEGVQRGVDGLVEHFPDAMESTRSGFASAENVATDVIAAGGEYSDSQLREMFGDDAVNKFYDYSQTAYSGITSTLDQYTTEEQAIFASIFLLRGGARNPPELEIDIPTIGGRRPINSEWAGKTHPSGLEFDNQGFPKFGPHVEAEIKLNNLTGNNYHDFALANKAAGFDKTPENYTWHHHQDGRTMQLVPQDLHDSCRHTGGCAVIRNGGSFD